MGLLNTPKLARNERQGLMSPLEIQIDTMANDQLRPNLSSRLTQQDLVNKGLLAIGMAPMGITRAKTAYELAHEVAQKNATKMLGCELHRAVSESDHCTIAFRHHQAPKALSVPCGILHPFRRTSGNQF